MNIEFFAPQGQVKEWLITYVRNELMKLHSRDKRISRAEVYFRYKPHESFLDKICEISLTIYGNAISIQRKADSYEEAAREAVEELGRKVGARLKAQNEPPDELTSTIKV